MTTGNGRVLDGGPRAVLEVSVGLDVVADGAGPEEARALQEALMAGMMEMGFLRRLAGMIADCRLQIADCGLNTSRSTSAGAGVRFERPRVYVDFSRETRELHRAMEAAAWQTVWCLNGRSQEPGARSQNGITHPNAARGNGSKVSRIHYHERTGTLCVEWKGIPMYYRPVSLAEWTMLAEWAVNPRCKIEDAMGHLEARTEMSQEEVAQCKLPQIPAE
jgi:hypothetical protein